MKIFHHHAIHHCPACSHCANHDVHDAERSPAASLEDEIPHARPSLVGALAGVVQLASMLYMLHVDRKHAAVRVDADRAPAPLASSTAATMASRDPQPPVQTATEAKIAGSTPHDDVISALFADAARAERSATTDDNAVSKDSQPPRSPLAAAFLAAFRGQPMSA